MSREEEPVDEHNEALEEPAAAEEVPGQESAEAYAAEEFDIQVDVTQLYLNDIGQSALLTPEQEMALARRTRHGDFEARQKMIEQNLRRARRGGIGNPGRGGGP